MNIEELKKINPNFEEAELIQLNKLMELGVLSIEELKNPFKKND